MEYDNFCTRFRSLLMAIDAEEFKSNAHFDRLYELFRYAHTQIHVCRPRLLHIIQLKAEEFLLNVLVQQRPKLVMVLELCIRDIKELPKKEEA